MTGSRQAAVEETFANVTDWTCAEDHFIVFIVHRIACAGDLNGRIWIDIFRIGQRCVIGILRQDAGKAKVNAGACQRRAGTDDFGR